MAQKASTNGQVGHDSNEHTSKCKVMPLAVVGMAFRGPGDASNIENLYKLLAEGRETWSPIPESRWAKDAFYHPDPARKGTSNVQGGHFLQHDLAKFDAAFFGMREDEAACLDPQQRMLLECCYETLENSGIPLSKAVGSNTSVFVGTFGADYPELLYRDPETIPMYQATNAGNSRSIISNRLSYVFDFKGPSVTVDTACSASLVAFHLACRSVWAGDADQAVVGGSSVILNSDLLNSMSAMGFLSAEGRCYSFDERAQGYGRGEGVGCIMLKPLERALQDGDNVRAIVRNTASNQDGKTPGITFPSRAAQESLIQSAYDKAGLDPLDTDIVEAHGTGTQAGDPIEAGAIATVFGSRRPPHSPVKIGSIKSNIGHLEGASGIAGLIKAILMLENQVILPSRNFRQPNSKIPMQDWNIQVSTELCPWIKDGPRRVSVNSFGYGGTNAHVILEDPVTFLRDYEDTRAFLSTKTTSHYANKHGNSNGITKTGIHDVIQNGSETGLQLQNGTVAVFNNTTPRKLHNGVHSPGRKRLFHLTAFDQEAGKRQAQGLVEYLKQRQITESILDNLAYTLHRKRSSFPYKATVVACSSQEIIESLKEEDFKFTKARSEVPSLGFVFTGQGAQWARMGIDLLDTFPVYRQSLERSRDQLKSLGASWDLIDELLKEADESRVNEAEFSQPICTAVQCALVDLLSSWNVAPTAVTGHSSGEIAAAYCIGAMPLDATMTAAYYRGIVAASLDHPGKLPNSGAMMAVAIGKEEIEPLLQDLQTGRLCVACENSPSNVTVSGDSAAVDELHTLLQKKHSTVFARKLRVNVAYHSHHMNAIGDEYLACIPKIEAPEDRGIDFYSSVTGGKVDPANLGPQYWVTYLLKPVKFSTSLSQMCHSTVDDDRKIDMLVEIGPHSALAGPIKQILAADQKLKKAKITYVSPFSRNKNAVETSLDAMAKLATEGVPVDLSKINRLPCETSLRCLTDLPAYAWNYSKSFWAEGRISKVYRQRIFPRTDVLGVEDRNSNPLEPRWRNIVRLTEVPWIQDHRIQNNMVYPAGGFIAMAIEAAHQLAYRAGVTIRGYRLREVIIPQALVIPRESGEVETTVTLRPYREGTQWTSEIWNEFSIYSVTHDNLWTEHCHGLICVVKPSPSSELNVEAVHEAVVAKEIYKVKEAAVRCQRPVDVQRLYNELREAGLDYGPTFANITKAHTGINECVATLSVPNIAEVMPSKFQHPIPVHPATIDSILHPMLAAAAAAAVADGRGPIDPAVPVSIKDIYFSSKMPTVSGEQLRVYALNTIGQPRKLESSIRITDSSDHPTSLYGYINGLECKTLARDQVGETDTESKNMAWNLSWGIDPDFHPFDAGTDLQGPSDKLEGFFSQLGFKNPHMSVLWINQHIISASFSSMIRAFGGAENDVPLLARCDICTSSPDSRDLAQSLLQSLAADVDNRFFDFSIDFHQDEWKPASYDLVVVEGITAADAVTEASALGLRRLLRINGKVVVIETSSQSVSSPLQVNGNSVVNGISNIEVDWQPILHGVGFSAFHQKVLDSPDSDNDSKKIMVSVAGPPKIHSPAPVVILLSDNNSKEMDLARLLADQLSGHGFDVNVAIMGEVNLSGMVCIVLADLSGHFLSHPSEDQFKFCKDVFTKSVGALWVTRGAYSNNPLANIATGMARTIRSENGTTTIVTLDLDGETELAVDKTVALLTKLSINRFGISWSNLEDIDMEFREVKGSLMIPRLLEDKEVNTHITSTITGDVTVEQPLLQPNRPLRMDLGIPGLINSIRWVDDDSLSQSVDDDCIEIEVRASGVNFRDVMMALGQIGVERLGGECSGIVTAVGKSVNGFTLGDRVAGLHLGSFATKAQPKASIMRRIPLEMSFSIAAALPVAYVTAYYSLLELARVRACETVLIHAATGGVGQAAIEICQLLGVEIFLTVGSLEKKKFILDNYNVREDHIFSSRDGSFAAGIMTMTGNRGVDVILNSVAGEAHRLTWNCIGPFGRFIELGKRDIFVNTRLEMQQFAKNVTFATFDLVDLIRERPATCGMIWGRVLELLETGCISTPSAVKSYAMSDIPKALQLMQSGKHIGKLVSVTSLTDLVNAPPRRTQQKSLRDDASYLIVGGLGGLGRTIARWMIQQGARHLIFANRSGDKSEISKQIHRELEGQGARVHVKACDVADTDQVQQLLLSASSAGLPSIKGVVHSAMLLKDAMFNKMSLDQYQQGLRAKVQGTLALHNALAHELDFFTLLSSMNGVIGNASQANYAAANTFLDAFAEYRNKLGLPGVSLDLGVITGVGHVAENQELAQSMTRQGFAGTNEQELLALIEHSILRPRRSAGENQVVTGLGTWTDAALGNLRRPMFSHFRHLTASPDSQADEKGGDNLADISNLSFEDGTERICGALRAMVAGLCMISVDDVLPSKTLSQYGMDSLVAVEMRNWIFRKFNHTIPILELLANNSLNKLSIQIMSKLKEVNGA